MDKLDRRGIFWLPKRQEWRVRVTRRQITYMIGHYPEYNDALQARDDFLADYGTADFFEETPVEKYSPEWFRQQARLQTAKLASVYADKDKRKPQFYYVTADYYVDPIDASYLDETVDDEELVALEV